MKTHSNTDRRVAYPALTRSHLSSCKGCLSTFRAIPQSRLGCLITPLLHSTINLSSASALCYTPKYVVLRCQKIPDAFLYLKEQKLFDHLKWVHNHERALWTHHCHVKENRLLIETLSSSSKHPSLVAQLQLQITTCSLFIWQLSLGHSLHNAVHQR